jgi:hypothetical protein
LPDRGGYFGVDYRAVSLVAFDCLAGMFCGHDNLLETKGSGYHWWTTGLMYAVAFLPVCYFLSRIEAFVFFTIFLSTATAVWSALVKNVVWEECGRGAILILAQGAFLIFR